MSCAARCVAWRAREHRRAGTVSGDERTLGNMSRDETELPRAVLYIGYIYEIPYT